MVSITFYLTKLTFYVAIPMMAQYNVVKVNILPPTDETDYAVANGNFLEERMENNNWKSTEEKRQAYEHVAISLAKRFDLIYYVDAETGEYILFSSSAKYKELEIPIEDGPSFYEAAQKHLIRFIHPDDEHVARAVLRKDALIRSIETEGIFSVINRSRLNGGYIYTEMQAMWADDHKHLIVGILDVDEREKTRRAQEEKNKIYMDIATSLANRYQSIYYVDVVTDEYTLFTKTNLYKELNILPKGEDFFRVSVERTIPSLHPEDRQRVAVAVKKENLIAAVDQDGLCTITSRVKIGSKYEYINLRAVWADDHRHLIMGMMNVDKQVRHEMEQERNLMLANEKALMDELTGARNKNAFTDFKRDLQIEIERGLEEPFALVMCDVNELKNINDTKGHNAGDDCLKSARRLISQIYRRSPVFRVGGDEFVILLRGLDYENRQDLLRKFKDHVLENKSKGKVVVAIGMAEYQDGRSVAEIFEKADREMYANKKALKESDE